MAIESAFCRSFREKGSNTLFTFIIPKISNFFILTDRNINIKITSITSKCNYARPSNRSGRSYITPLLWYIFCLTFEFARRYSIIVSNDNLCIRNSMIHVFVPIAIEYALSRLLQDKHDNFNIRNAEFVI